MMSFIVLTLFYGTAGFQSDNAPLNGRKLDMVDEATNVLKYGLDGAWTYDYKKTLDTCEDGGGGLLFGDCVCGSVAKRQCTNFQVCKRTSGAGWLGQTENECVGWWKHKKTIAIMCGVLVVVLLLTGGISFKCCGCSCGK